MNRILDFFLDDRRMVVGWSCYMTLYIEFHQVVALVSACLSLCANPMSS